MIAKDKKLQFVLVCISLVMVSCGSSTDKAATSPSPSSQERFISVPWKLTKVEGDRILTFLALEGGCVAFDHMEVDESKAERIIITAIAKDDSPPAGADPLKAGACTSELGYEYPAYELKEPLGSRKLQPTPISSEWHGPKTVDASPEARES